ncbi:MAG: hypothetical protein AAFZ05_08360, partial [Pseudomonadota bacterium]
MRPSPPRFYDIVGERHERGFRACATQTSCKHLRLHAFRLACDGGEAEWQDVAAVGTALLGGGARVRKERLRVQFRGRLRPWPEAPCLRGDWPHRGAPLSEARSPFPDVGCEAVGVFAPRRRAIVLPRGYAFLSELGARILPKPLFRLGAGSIALPQPKSGA